MNDLKEKRALVRKIVRARPKSPGELCAGCVWRMAESGRVVCPFPAACGAARKSLNNHLNGTEHKAFRTAQENQEQGGVDSSPVA